MTRLSGSTRRRGATLLVVTLLLSTLLLLAALVIDGARMLMYRDQLRNLADAAVLSAAADLARFRARETATSRVFALRPHHPLLGGDLGTILDQDIVGGRWNPQDRSFLETPWSEAAAVRVRASHTAEWTLGVLAGVTTQSLQRTAIAAVGSQRRSSCMRPMAIPYAALLLRLGRDPTNLAYNLTSDDVRLLAIPAPEVMYNLAQGGNASVPGSFGWIELPPIVSSNKNVHMANQIRPGCVTDPVSVGDTLIAFSGNMSANEVVSALRELCPTVPESNSMLRQCMPAPTVQLPIYDFATGTGTGVRYRVRYIGAFTLRSMDFSGSNSRVGGDLTTLMASTPGGFSPEAGPVRLGGMVQ
jgi:hypothetical protein